MHRVIAEGVETRDQLTFLQAEGCDEGQGYYFSRPLAAPQLAEMLETGATPDRRPGPDRRLDEVAAGVTDWRRRCELRRGRRVARQRGVMDVRFSAEEYGRGHRGAVQCQRRHRSTWYRICSPSQTAHKRSSGVISRT